MDTRRRIGYGVESKVSIWQRASIDKRKGPATPSTGEPRCRRACTAVVRMVDVRLHNDAGAACASMTWVMLAERPSWASSGLAGQCDKRGGRAHTAPWRPDGAVWARPFLQHRQLHSLQPKILDAFNRSGKCIQLRGLCNVAIRTQTIGIVDVRVVI